MAENVGLGALQPSTQTLAGETIWHPDPKVQQICRTMHETLVRKGWYDPLWSSALLVRYLPDETPGTIIRGYKLITITTSDKTLETWLAHCWVDVGGVEIDIGGDDAVGRPAGGSIQSRLTTDRTAVEPLIRSTSPIQMQVAATFADRVDRYNEDPNSYYHQMNERYPRLAIRQLCRALARIKNA